MAAADWERRRAELDERRERIMADPVLGFYERHGRPVRDAIPSADAEAGDQEPGPA